MKNVWICIAVLWLSFANAGEFGQGATIDEAPDWGVEAVYEAQETPALEPVISDRETASDAVRKFANDRSYHEGWEPEKGRYFAVAYSTFNTVDPKQDPTFYVQREIAVKRAVLEAKVQVISFIESDMSAIESIGIPGSNLNRQFGREYDMLKEKFNSQKTRLVALLKQMDASEADVLSGVTMGDRLNALMDGVIKKLDWAYSKESVMSGKRQTLENIKKDYAATKIELERIEIFHLYRTHFGFR